MQATLAPTATTTPPKSALEPIRIRAKFFYAGEKKFFLKGTTYGPFAPDAEGHFVGTAEKARQDFAQMCEVGINVIRIYHVPPRWLLDVAAEFGLRVIISIPWTQHVEFLNEGRLRRDIIGTIRKGVATHAGHPAIFAYFV